MTLIELLTTKKITIPMLQRDYVLGRLGQEYTIKRDSFLKAILDILINDDIENNANGKLNLDFIFGSEPKFNSQQKNNMISDESIEKTKNILNAMKNIATEQDKKYIETLIQYNNTNEQNAKNDNDENTLKLIDGQQRITTLFLVYTYLSHRTGNKSNDENILQNFSYATRVSSKDFCKALVINPFNFNETKIKKGSFASYIKDCTWYFAKWNNDPTINSMLVVLDAIHTKINDRLKDKEQTEIDKTLKDMLKNFNKITFVNIDMGEHQLDEGTYLHMNGRGKLLTPFEIMKADIIKTIQENKEYGSTNSTENISNIDDYVSFKLDTDWLEFFWGLDASKTKEFYDNYYRNFLNAIIYVLALKSIDANDDEKNPTMEELQIQYSVFNDKKNINFLIESLNTLCDKDKAQLNKIFTFKENNITRFNDDNNYNILTRNNTKIDRIYLYAILQYLINVKPIKCDHNMQDYIRVIRNLLINEIASYETQSNSPSNYETVAYKSIIEFIDNIANEKIAKNNIYSILSKYSEQEFTALKHEQTKATLIVQAGDVNENNKIREAIHSIEDNNTIVRAKTNNLIKFIKAGGNNLPEWSNTFNAIFSDDFLGNEESRKYEKLSNSNDLVYLKNEIILIRALLSFHQYFHYDKRIFSFGCHYTNLNWHAVLINQKTEKNTVSDLEESLIGLFSELKHSFPTNNDILRNKINSLINVNNDSSEGSGDWSWQAYAMLQHGDELLKLENEYAKLKNKYAKLKNDYANNCNSVYDYNWAQHFTSLNQNYSIARQGNAFYAEIYSYSLYNEFFAKNSEQLSYQFDQKSCGIYYKDIQIKFAIFNQIPKWELWQIPQNKTNKILKALESLKTTYNIEQNNDEQAVFIKLHHSDNRMTCGRKVLKALLDNY